jgi:hypothetical protein
MFQIQINKLLRIDYPYLTKMRKKNKTGNKKIVARLPLNYHIFSCNCKESRIDLRKLK